MAKRIDGGKQEMARAEWYSEQEIRTRDQPEGMKEGRACEVSV